MLNEFMGRAEKLGTLMRPVVTTAAVPEDSQVATPASIRLSRRDLGNHQLLLLCSVLATLLKSLNKTQTCRKLRWANPWRHRQERFSREDPWPVSRVLRAQRKGMSHLQVLEMPLTTVHTPNLNCGQIRSGWVSTGWRDYLKGTRNWISKKTRSLKKEHFYV